MATVRYDSNKNDTIVNLRWFSIRYHVRHIMSRVFVVRRVGRAGGWFIMARAGLPAKPKVLTHINF